MRAFLPCVFSACAAISSCSAFGPGAEVVVTLPAVPDHWRAAFPDMSFLVVYAGPSGDERRMTGPVGGSQLTIACSKRTNSPILAYPIAARDAARGQGEPGFLRPAGGLYPLSLDPDASEPTLLLTWDQGPLAGVVHRLATAGWDVSLVNAERLATYLMKHPDPWMLDLDGVAQKIAEGAFSAYDIDLLPCRDVRVASGPGAWFLESPFAGLVPASDAGTVDLPGVGLGEHALYSIEGGVWRMQVGAQETTLKRVP
jgi:hypothetical protein